METPPLTNPAQALERHARYLPLVAMTWMTAMLAAFYVGFKLFVLGPFVLSAYIFVYPVTYICSDIMTEVYGYRRARPLIWSGCLLLAAMAVVMPLLTAIPPAPDFPDQAALEKVFMHAPLMALGAIAAALIGDFLNAYTLAKLKIVQKGKYYGVRSLASSLAGQTADAVTFSLVAFLPLGMYDTPTLINVTLTSIVACVIVEAVKFPMAHRVMAYLKHAEGMDVYDVGTNFNPFADFMRAREAKLGVILAELKTENSSAQLHQRLDLATRIHRQ